MELKLSNCSSQKFIEYAMERKRKNEFRHKYHYSYMTNARLQKVFQYMCDRNLKCKGRNYYVSDIEGFISKYSEPEPEEKEHMEEILFHEVWCKCEWIYRIIDKDRDFYESLKTYIGPKALKNFEAI